MLITGKSFVSSNYLSPYLLKRNDRKCRCTVAKKQDFSENSKTQQEPFFSFKVSNIFLARSAVAVFGLGFIDAGYSGDWSRIGVISRENEDLLKIAALVVVPLCLFLIFSFSKEQEA
ncbi:hypothetical protein HHK36_025951 [Tetracentron sinense]|uniref:DUF7887 domain-containing protein n=1 Tax=Tetracentron sinense TaxID=13715 RepID=A0A834YMH9_TETSI|nr:hypothetical protein HHK36_025951 [Tetracentron sinense]